MDRWENFYRRLALEARERAAQATTPSVRAALEEAAAEWSELADWVERQHEKAAAYSPRLLLRQRGQHRQQDVAHHLGVGGDVRLGVGVEADAVGGEPPQVQDNLAI
jgi:hypothetical protein